MKISRIKLVGLLCVMLLLALSSVALPAHASRLSISFESASAHCDTGNYVVALGGPAPISYNPLELLGIGSAAAGPSSLRLHVIARDAGSGNLLGETFFSAPWDGGSVPGYVYFVNAPTGEQVTLTLYLADLLDSYAAPSGLFGAGRVSAKGPAVLDEVTVPYTDCEQPNPTQPRPGCDLLDLTGAVMGTVATETPLYYAPDANARVYPTTIMEQGKTVWVFGQNDTHEYYQIQVGCGYLWVPAAALTPDGENLWNSAPLPDDVVSGK